MISEQWARRRQRVPSWFDRAWGWLVHASDGVRLLVLGGLFLAAMGFGYYPIDMADRNTARDLVAHGQWAVAADPFVHVVHLPGRDGGSFDVDKVRVRLPGVHDTVLLDAVVGPDMVMDKAIEGWQKPNKNTGYLAPLDVRYRVEKDGTVTAIARADVDYLTISNTDPEFGLALGFGGLTLAALSVALNSVRLTQLDRRRQLRGTTRRAPLGQRKPSDPDPD